MDSFIKKMLDSVGGRKFLLGSFVCLVLSFMCLKTNAVEWGWVLISGLGVVCGANVLEKTTAGGIKFSANGNGNGVIADDSKGGD